MDRLILLRHGKAEAESDSGEDFDRRLAARGAEATAATAARLAGLGLVADLVLVSPAARTRETWVAAQPASPKAGVRFEDDLYHADSTEIWAIAERAGADAGTVMVVGHNPGIQELSARLLIEAHAPAAAIAKVTRGFPTAAAVAFQIDAAGRPVFEGLVFPERGE